jgi:hypothetical protein
MVGKRMSVEHNGMELVAGIILKYRNINNYDELLSKITEIIREVFINKNNLGSIKFNRPEDLKQYVADIQKKKQMVDSFINNLRGTIEPFSDFIPENIKQVFISGKKNRHPEIETLNSGLDRLQAKADIYVQFNDDKISGISVKQCKYATKSNYSVQKMLGKDNDSILTEIRKKYLNENGFTHFDKSQRHSVNELFYPEKKDNVYFAKLRECISENKTEISRQLVEPLFCSNVGYDMYEYNGTNFTRLNRTIDTSQITFEEHLPYYYETSGAERKAAKLFYRLVVEKKVFRVEIRWKGNVFNASPQFQMHEE